MTGVPDEDLRWMRRALQLAERGRGRTFPNPMVGAVIVKGGEWIAEGYHPEAGQPHAEVKALEHAGERARGSTLYVTLEPCSHYGKTPPCTDAILRSGIRRVVMAMIDPFPQVAGTGRQKLLDAGLEVSVGTCEQEARRLNRAFLTYVQRNRPYVTWKYAMTLDGRIASRTGDSRWITGNDARLAVHELRNEVQAVVTGRGTVAADDPQMTTRLPFGHPAYKTGLRHPLRIILDSRAQSSPDAKVFCKDTPGEAWLVVSESADPMRCKLFRDAGIRVIHLPAKDGHGVDLEAFMEFCRTEKIVHVLLESGGKLAGSFFELDLIDEVYAFQAMKLIGGDSAPGPLGGRGRDKMSDASVLFNRQVDWLGDDLLIRGDLHVHWLD